MTNCKLPTDYIDLLIYANNLLADNKYNRHTDISGNRYRTNEIVGVFIYKNGILELDSRFILSWFSAKAMIKVSSFKKL